MFGAIKKLLGIGPSVDYAALIANGAVIVDVRSKGEYAGGHVSGSKNIPLDVLKSQIGSLNKDKPVITVCASGMRSASARTQLLAAGFKEVHNAGSWHSLK